VILAQILGFVWRYRIIVMFVAIASAVSGLWLLSKHRGAQVVELKDRLSIQREISKRDHLRYTTIINAYEEKEEADHEREEFHREADTAIEADRAEGDGNLSLVLYNAYDRVYERLRTRQ